MTKRGPDSVTFALEELMKMEDERLEEERLEQERIEAAAEVKKLAEQKRRELLEQTVKEAQAQTIEVKTEPTYTEEIPLIDHVQVKPFVPWYKKRNFKTGAIALVIAIGTVGYLRFEDNLVTEKEFEEIPEYVTIQEYEELEAKFIYLQQKVNRIADRVRENEGIANEKHMQIYNRVGLYDIRAHERIDRLEDRVDTFKKPKKTNRWRRRTTKKEQPKPIERDTGLSDDPMAELELSE